MIYTITLNPGLDRELMIASFQFDQVLRATQVREDCGGKGFNVSRALAALGTTSTAMGWIGGATGERLRSDLERLGIETDFVRVAGETRTNTSIVTSEHEHYLKVNMPGPVIQAAEQDALLHKIRSRARAGDWWVLAGSVPPGVLPDIYANVIGIVQAAGAHAILDAEGDALRHGCTAKPTLVKPNAKEAGELIGTRVTTIAQAQGAAARIRQLGPEQVVISLGNQGATLHNGTTIWSAYPPAIRELNPVGAGDAMVAGLVWAMSNRLEGSEIIRWGVACGAAAASLDGTAMGDHALMTRLASQVRVVQANKPESES